MLVIAAHPATIHSQRVSEPAGLYPAFGGLGQASLLEKLSTKPRAIAVPKGRALEHRSCRRAVNIFDP